MIREENADQQQKDRQFRAAGHHRQGQKRGQFLLGTAQGTRGHRAENGASAGDASCDDIGHDRSAMQAEEAEDPVKHVGHARYVAGVLQEGDHQEHDGDERYKADNAAHATDDAVDQQRAEQIVGQYIGQCLAQPGEAVLHPSLGIGTDFEGDIEHDVHHGQHDQRTNQRVGEDLVQGVGQGHAVFGGIPFHNAVAEQAADVAVAVVGDERIRRRLQGFLRVQRHVVDYLGKRSGQRHVGFLQLLPDAFVVFHRLHCHPAGRVALGKNIRLGYLPLHLVQSRIQIRAVGNAQHAGLFLLRAVVQGGAHGFVEAFTGPGDHWNHGHAHLFGKLLHVDGNAALAGLVHHVAGEDQRHAHFADLHRQEHAALQRSRLDDVDGGHDPLFRILRRQYFTGDKLFRRVGGQ